MTAEQAIKYLILSLQASWDDEELQADLTGEQIDELYKEAECLQDARNEIRGSGIETGLSCESSRHYESEAVAAKTPNGQWVGWTYWHGGGKHGEPGAIEWMEHAYFLDCQEEEKVVTIRTFSKRQDA